jgi:hypothetical protein
MRILAASVGVTVLVVGAPAAAADQVIKLSECEALSPAEVHEWAETALTRRKYTIEENTPSLLTGEQDNLRVEIVIEPLQVVIRWKEGFAGKNDYWLRNLKTDVLWRLAE